MADVARVVVRPHPNGALDEHVATLAIVLRNGHDQTRHFETVLALMTRSEAGSRS